MKKLYFLSPNKQSATSTIAELKEQGIKPKNISILAHESVGLDTSIDSEELGEHNISDFGDIGMSDLIPSLQKGAAVGGGLGLVGGLAGLAFPPAGLIIGGGAVLGTTALGAGLGAWASSMIGVSAPHHDIEEYVAEIENGSILILVDIEGDELESVKTAISKHHPEVEVKESGVFSAVS